MRKSQLIQTEVDKLGPIAPAGFFLAVRLRGASPMMTFSTFPTAWMDEYMENGYMMRDPITTWALTIGGSIRWSSPFLPDPFGIFRAAAKHGLKHGASVAHGPVGSLTICSLARGDRELSDADVATARQAVVRLHELTELPKSLTDDQKRLLAGIARGAEPKDRDHIDALCDLLAAASPSEALKRAQDYKLM